MRLATLLPLLLLLPGIAVAEGDSRPLDLSQATTLASPGTPSGLTTFLPQSRAPKPLAWPLPAGPVLVLGLPDSDPIALAIAEAFGLDVEDLGGGYSVWAWHDGDRPIAVIMAGDAAALYAARFEFEATRPRTTSMGSAMDPTKPNEESDVFLVAGQRTVRPRYRTRALAPSSRSKTGGIEVAGGRGNRYWIEGAAPGDAWTTRSFSRLRSVGVEPVVVLKIDSLTDESVEARLKPVIADARKWQSEADIHNFALRFENTAFEIADRASVRVADALRGGGLTEIIFVPNQLPPFKSGTFGFSGVTVDVSLLWSTLVRLSNDWEVCTVPEAMLAWPSDLFRSTPHGDATGRMPIPVLLYETWAAPFQGEDDAFYVPSLPNDRAAGLAAVLDGVVVVGSRGTEELLQSAWAEPDKSAPTGLAVLDPLLALNGRNGLEFLEKTAANLKNASAETLGMVSWMEPLARYLIQVADTLRNPGSRYVTVPRVLEPVDVDGVANERPWAFAAKLPSKDFKVLVLSNGSSLAFAVSGQLPRRFTLRIGSKQPRSFGLRDLARRGELGVSLSGSFQLETTLSRLDLQGDAHPGRLLSVELRADGKVIWPAKGESGYLLVGP